MRNRSSTKQTMTTKWNRPRSMTDDLYMDVTRKVQEELLGCRYCVQCVFNIKHEEKHDSGKIAAASVDGTGSDPFRLYFGQMIG